MNATAQSAPDLKTVAPFGAFSGNGAIENTGLTIVQGDIGTYVGSFTGFPPGQYTGAKHVADAVALTAKNDLTLAYNLLNDATHAVIFDTALSATMGNGQVLTPRIYRRGDLTTLSGTLTFDAKGDVEAIFIIKIGAALNVAKNTSILLANGAQAANIYWAVDGAVSILDNTLFKGTILSNGAIHLYGGASLEGRALAVVGAITFATNFVAVPVAGTVVVPDSSLVIITPAPGDSVRGGRQNYEIRWGGTNIGSSKTLEYSLDSGRTWTIIGTVASDSSTFNWNVPDTISNKAFIRVTDQNNLRGTSGLFVITGDSPSGQIVVLRPALNESIVGGTQNYEITWTGSGLPPIKTFEYSLDSGVTWTLIGTGTTDGFVYNWNVPDTTSTKAFVRVSDMNGVSGKSGMFNITKSPTPGSIVIVTPTSGEVIPGGTQNYSITFSSVNTTTMKTIEYSLDGGATWNWIGVLTSEAQTFTWQEVPNVATTQALVRITDANGIRGTSGLFTITLTPGVGSLNSLTLSGLDNNQNIANGGTLGITWTYTPEIGNSVNVEYSLNGMQSWVLIGTVPVTESPNSTSWITPLTGNYYPVYIRVTSSLGMSRISSAFSIGSPASVQLPEESPAIVSYPNPASDRVTLNLASSATTMQTLTIFDVTGKIVRIMEMPAADFGVNAITISTADLASGSYTARVQSGNTTSFGRFTITR